MRWLERALDADEGDSVRLRSSASTTLRIVFWATIVLGVVFVAAYLFQIFAGDSIGPFDIFGFLGVSFGLSAMGRFTVEAYRRKQLEERIAVLEARK